MAVEVGSAAAAIQRALAAAMSTASALELTVDDAIVLHDSNKSRCACCLLASLPESHRQPIRPQFGVKLARHRRDRA